MTSTPTGPATDALQLADYRRRVAELYAEVRRVTAEHGPARGRNTWAAGRERLFHTHPQSPWSRFATHESDEIPLYPYDPAWRVVVPVDPPTTNDPLLLPHSGDGGTEAVPVGSVAVPGGRLTLYWLQQYGGGLFLPFLDATSGAETYGGGRYLLDTAKSADLGVDRGRQVLDFNFAYHPSCVHDPRWSCPLPPAANRLDVEVRAGEWLG